MTHLWLQCQATSKSKPSKMHWNQTMVTKVLKYNSAVTAVANCLLAVLLKIRHSLWKWSCFSLTSNPTYTNNTEWLIHITHSLLTFHKYLKFILYLLWSPVRVFASSVHHSNLCIFKRYFLNFPNHFLQRPWTNIFQTFTRDMALAPTETLWCQFPENVL